MRTVKTKACFDNITGLVSLCTVIINERKTEEVEEVLSTALELFKSSSEVVKINFSSSIRASSSTGESDGGYRRKIQSSGGCSWGSRRERRRLDACSGTTSRLEEKDSEEGDGMSVQDSRMVDWCVKEGSQLNMVEQRH